MLDQATGGRGARVVLKLARELQSALFRFFDADSHRLSASIAFYAVFSVVPLVLIAFAVAENALGDSSVLRNEVLAWAGRTGSETFESAIGGALESMAERDSSPLTGIGLGVIGLLFGASGVFLEIQAALRRLLRRPEPNKRVIEHVRAALMDRLLAVPIVLATCLLLFATTALRGVVEVLVMRAASHATVVDMLVTQGLGLAVAAFGLALCYRLTPSPHLPWSAAFRGAIFAAIAFYAAQKPFAWVIVHLTTYAAYGAVGALLGVLAWFYVSACILLFGAAIAAGRAMPDGEVR